MMVVCADLLYAENSDVWSCDMSLLILVACSKKFCFGGASLASRTGRCVGPGSHCRREMSIAC